MTESPRATTGRWPVVAAVAPAAALLFTGAAAWASLTAPAPTPADVTSAAEPAEAGAPDASAQGLDQLAARVRADQRRLDALRKSLAARPASPAPHAAVAARQPAAAPPRPAAAPPPAADTSTGASG